MSAGEAPCLLCSRNLVHDGQRMPRHLDMATGVPCRGSGVPVGHTWDLEMVM